MKFLTILLFISSFFVSAQEEVVVKLGEIHEVKVFNGLSVNIIEGDSNKAVVSGENPSNVVIVNKGGKLRIRTRNHVIFDGHKTFVVLYTKDIIDVIDVNENAFVSADYQIKQIELELHAQEGGEIDLDVELQRLNTKSVTAGKIILKGTSDNILVKVNTGGTLNASELIAKQAEVLVKVGGVADVNASDFIDAKVRIGGTINIHGKPKVIEQQVFIGGTINEE
ncbi:DUF2807 domain-containing protein [Galbibacter sp. EGI 63066]|uniref:head GIN domain-containing protein n=1 Tax=Galbibacter sp. EGI 63066 TaxID=2993559 RepID=UPI0022495BA1|nr:head GIN domain-containing protein [Galbibacter sp. EGI 63066]MCX2679053.1 DUF2807 domain-containing protein [Galbibacter sp. EGI 63066]